ncbi:cupin 2 domain-containing protein (plasmid) [Rhizobium etli bv. phaseoli str. IE4803]|uniref:cupin domain-containing protein n=1 Tax=Rhizobium sophoriradicis TaxID=1535245 RepID=UPI000581C38E|nr:cupin domain-containing protein [Rhizobium sophoriradicis]AJC82691.1 cupin 2 domain-containing protein [Rhizobium etli bv. phaseoli str. IE4803]PCK86870.1 cupin domain-containing protein [Rhizobium sophoriradicis]
MTFRRVVTAKNTSGKSVVVSDGASPREMALKHTPGFVSAPIWTVATPPSLPFDGKDPMDGDGTLLHPAAGSSTFIIITFPPDSVMMSPDFRPELAGPEHAVAAPGIVEHFEMDNPGMHTTPTLDYGVVISGTITLELDDGVAVELKSGDSFVQHGARHAWRNPTSQPATIAVVLVGAK